jgi:hypothetical protein
MNQISNFGFQVNKVVAKQSSEVIVAFFPIERFLTPDLKSIFISSPAAFFIPFGARLDPNTKDRLEPYLSQIFPDDELKTLIRFLPQVSLSGACGQFTNDGLSPAMPGTLEQACQTAELVNRLSLNVVRLIVGGTMTVDVDKVPPQIKGVDIDTPTGKDATNMWTVAATPTTLTGVIRGSFLAGGTPTITNSDLENILQIKSTTEGSNDTELNFTLTLKKSLPKTTTALTFQVTKKSGTTTTNATYSYKINPQSAATDDSDSSKGGSTPSDGKGQASPPEKPAPNSEQGAAKKNETKP